MIGGIIGRKKLSRYLTINSLMIYVFCTSCKRDVDCFDLQNWQNNFRLTTWTKHFNKQRIWIFRIKFLLNWRNCGWVSYSISFKLHPKLLPRSKYLEAFLTFLTYGKIKIKSPSFFFLSKKMVKITKNWAKLTQKNYKFPPKTICIKNITSIKISGTISGTSYG